MVILHLYRIQHSPFTVLVFLLQFSSLLSPSLEYSLPDKYFINCGSNSNVTQSGKLYVGESNYGYPTTSFTKSKTENSESSVPSPLYQTARIFRSQSWYEYSTDPNGTYLVRLHFFAFSSPSNLSSARFNVSVPGFWLLQNFDARSDNDNNSALVKEFFMKITDPTFKILFTPLPSSFAFVNAIELFILPLHLIDDQVARFTYGSQANLSSYKDGLLSRVLETRHRLNVGGKHVTRSNDGLLRNWIPDDTYLINPGNITNSSYNARIRNYAADDSDGPNSNQYTAPSDVYGTAKLITNSSTVPNISWGLPVDKNTDHLLRLHFCDFWNRRIGLTIFTLYIYDNHVIWLNDDPNVTNPLPAPYYYDFVVHSDDSGLMKITVGLDTFEAIPVRMAFLNGLEIMKMIETSPVDLDNSKHKSKHNSLPVVLSSVLGGLALVFVVVVFGFLWHLKIRKHPILVSAGSSHCRLAEGTMQGSHGSNINLSLKLSLLDLQLATNNFDANQIIGKGGFGNVYKGVLKNGTSVAVKRSEPRSSGASGQGHSEFQTEIIILSKIRHKHLVSLIGYCDERREMILVYEYMEKGTLRDHLYNTNLPSLSWKQRLEICIGAARGLHYLHKEVAGGIIHRDVKTTNILLDENYVAKVGDFGLSKIGPPNLEPYVSTDVKGTFGYLDPEYFRLQKLTEKSDVYSFGAVLLEVLCARPIIDSSLPRDLVNLPEWGMFCKSKGILEGIIDPAIKGKIHHNSFRKYSDTVEKCLQEDGSDRPTMGDVLWELEYALQLQQGVIHREPHEDSSNSISSSLQMPHAWHLPSLCTLSEVDGFSIGKGDEFDYTSSR